MKLVRKNDEFIVIESRGSYHKVALEEIDGLIVLLCEAKRVDAAKANKSIGENLFEDQERTTRVFGQYVHTLHRDYDRVRRVMDIPMKDIYAKLKEGVEEHRKMRSMDDDNTYASWVEATVASRDTPVILEHSDNIVMLGEPKNDVLEMMDKWVSNNRRPTYPFNRPVDVILGIDPSTKGDMTMSITKGRQGIVNANGQQRPDTSDTHLFYGNLPFTLPPDEIGISFSIRKDRLSAPPSLRKQETITPLKQAMMKTFEEKMPGRVSESPYLYGNPKKPGIGMFEDLFIPRQNYKSNLRTMIEQMAWWQRPKGSPLRNPLLGGKRIGQSELPRVAPQYRTLRTAYRERMARIAEGQYVATAFPKRFDRQHHKLPGMLYTSDIGYYVLTGNLDEDVKSLAEIKSKAVKAWEC